MISRLCPSVRAGLIALGLTAGAAAPAAAQVMMTPLVGTYLATGNVYEESGGLGTATQGTSFAAGLRLTYSSSGRLGVEGALTYAPSKVEFTTTSGTVSRRADLWLGQLRLIYILNSAWAPINVYAAGGPAVVARGGDAYEGASGLTDLAGNFGLGALFRLGSGFRIRLEVESYIYNTSITLSTGETTGSKLQGDFVFSFALSIPL
jgi:hypothetical protein